MAVDHAVHIVPSRSSHQNLSLAQLQLSFGGDFLLGFRVCPETPTPLNPKPLNPYTLNP